MKNRAGFSLIELLVAMAIFAILVGFTGPALMRFLEARGVKNAAIQVYLDLQRIRAECITQRRTARFTFTTNNLLSSYVVTVTNPSDGLSQTYPQTDMSDYRGNVILSANGPDLVPSTGNIDFTIQGSSSPVAGPVFITNNSAWYRVRTTLAGGISLHIWDPNNNRWMAL